MEKHRILHISKYYPPYSGGIEDVCRSLVDGIPEYEQRVLCFNDNSEDRTDEVNGITITRVGIWREVARQPISFHFVSVLRSILRDYRPHIVHLHLPNPLISLYVLLFVPRSVKIVSHWHSDIIVHGFLHFLFSPIEKILLRRSDAILATSPNYIEGSTLLQANRDRCHVIPNVVSEEKLELKPASGITTDDIKRLYGQNIILFVGRHVGYKGLHLLIQAAHHIKSDFQMVIAGQGPETENIKRLAGNNDRIHFIGRIPDDELGVYMKAARVFGFSSYQKNEAFGVVLAEAMYYGLVSVTFTIHGSGVNWVSPNEQTGIEVPNGDVEAYAQAVDCLLTDSQLYERLSQAAKARVRSMFLFECIHDKLLGIYSNLLSDRL